MFVGAGLGDVCRAGETFDIAAWVLALMVGCFFLAFPSLMHAYFRFFSISTCFFFYHLVLPVASKLFSTLLVIALFFVPLFILSYFASFHIKFFMLFDLVPTHILPFTANKASLSCQISNQLVVGNINCHSINHYKSQLFTWPVNPSASLLVKLVIMSISES